jgi:hypothetical protein
MSINHSPELIALFDTYTGNSTSIGARLSAATVKSLEANPLIVATGTDMAIFPGHGQDPSIQSFRLSTRGFKELAGVSHLGPALATLVRLRELGASRDTWLAEARRLLAATQTAHSANSTALWRDTIAVAAYQGREAAIAAMVDYACAVTERYLNRVILDETLLTAADLREQCFEATGDAVGASVPLNKVMVATFFLIGMDIGYRVIDWLDQHAIDWRQAMVLVCGRAGRPTAGVTWTTNSICAMILGASRHQLPLSRMYIAPHGPSFTIDASGDLSGAKAMEKPLRDLWAYTRAISDLGSTMFDGYAAYEPGSVALPYLEPGTRTLSEMPQIRDVDDWQSMITRLRVAIEDPRQLLSGAVTDFAVRQLIEHKNDPKRVTVPGLDGIVYPRYSV